MTATSTFRRVLRVLLLGGGVLLLAVAFALPDMIKVHDQDVEVYSVRPDDKVQVIGLRHRTYLLDCGGSQDLVLFGTTLGTGVVTYRDKKSVCCEAQPCPTGQ